MQNRFALLVASIAVVLSGVAVVEKIGSPPGVVAEPEPARRLFIEPGTHLIPTLDGGSSYGKIVTDLDTGETWGFPTQGKSPFPGYQIAKNDPLTVNAVYLGRWNLSGLNRKSIPRTTQTQ